MNEQERKAFVRKNYCPKCLEKMKKENSQMIDCAFRHNNDEHLCEYATLKAYSFWYVFDYLTEKTEYVYIIAVSVTQACYLWKKYLRENIGQVYDKAEVPCAEIREDEFIHDHKIGDVLGMFAVI